MGLGLARLAAISDTARFGFGATQCSAGIFGTDGDTTTSQIREISHQSLNVNSFVWPSFLLTTILHLNKKKNTKIVLVFDLEFLVLPHAFYI